MTSPRRPQLTNHHPAVVEDLTKHAEQTQLRIADAITKYAGSMLFVYVHIAVFAFWMLVLERSPWPTLTLVVSLEAIFLSTFVMIGQNRQATFQQQKADHDFLVEEHELDTNTELTRAIARLTARSTEPWSSPARKPQASKPASAVRWDDPARHADGQGDGARGVAYAVLTAGKRWIRAADLRPAKAD